MVFFLKKYSDSQCCWMKKIFWFLWRKKNLFDSEFLLYDLMLNSGKKIALCATTKINIITLVLSEKKIWTKQKNITLPVRLNGQSHTNKKLDDKKEQQMGQILYTRRIIPSSIFLLVNSPMKLNQMYDEICRSNICKT